MSRQTALITDAVSGIGRSLAEEFGRNGYNLVTVADREDLLFEAARQLSDTHSVDVLVLQKDLTDERAPAEIYNELREKHIEVHVLVNNAREGQHECFHKTDIAQDINMIRLNIEAVVRLTKLFVKDMVDRGSGRILNVSSVAGFQPAPLRAVYHASQAFLVSFSEALYEELEETGVSLTVLCPDPTDTSFYKRANMENARILQDEIVMDPDLVAQEGYKALMDGERMHIPGIHNKLLTFSHRLIPKSKQTSPHQKLYEVKEDG